MFPYTAFSLERAIPKGKAPRVLGTLGDAHLQKQMREALIGALLDADARDFNFDELDGEGLKVNEVLAACGNLPFLSDRRVVLVRRCERIENIGRGNEEKAAKGKGPSPAKRFGDGVAGIPETTVLILQRTPETPEVGAKKETPRLMNAAVDKAIEAKGQIWNCLIGPKEAHLAVATVQGEAAARGIAMENGAAEFLVARAGTDIARCLSELEKCALRAAPDAVTRATIEEMVARQPAETVFDFVDALATRQHAHALGLLHQLLGSNEPPELVMALVTKQFRQLIQARALLDARVPLTANAQSMVPPALKAQLPTKDSLPATLAYQAWRGPKLAQQARLFSPAQLQAALEAALEFDLALKGIEGDGGADSKGMAPLMMDLFVAKLA
ncbi:MAG TPA: DNA polymerase III subunit delta [Abditibacteriaceae bacterium]|jgi:DNA polymerase-3 subunit delta